jgi:hypothetical protein
MGIIYFTSPVLPAQKRLEFREIFVWKRDPLTMKFENRCRLTCLTFCNTKMTGAPSLYLHY